MTLSTYCQRKRTSRNAPALFIENCFRVKKDTDLVWTEGQNSEEMIISNSAILV